MADPNRLPNHAFQSGKKVPTPQELADQFAAQAVKAALAPALDGLNIKNTS